MSNLMFSIRKAGLALGCGLFLLGAASCSSSKEAYNGNNSSKMEVQASTPKGQKMQVAPLATVENARNKEVAAEATTQPKALSAHVDVEKAPSAVTTTTKKAVTKTEVIKDEIASRASAYKSVKAQKKSVLKNYDIEKATEMGIGLKLLLIGVALLLIAIILAVVAVGSLSPGLVLISGILWAVGGILILVGLILWIVELVS